MTRVATAVRILVVITAAGLALAGFVAIDSASHSASDTLRPWLIECALIAVATAALLLAAGRIGRSKRGP